MSRDPLSDDDFSFLPTVDDAETLDKERLWAKAKSNRAPQPVPAEPSPAPEVQAPVEPPLPAKAPPRIRLKVKPTPRPPPEPMPPEPAAAPLEVVAEAPPLEPAAESTPPTEEPRTESKGAEASRTESKEPAKPGPAKETLRRVFAKAGTVPMVEETKEPADKEEESDHHAIIRPPGAEEHAKEEGPPLTPKEKLHKYWIMIGGQSLALSVILHLAILAVAALIVIHNVSEQHVDFLPGGGTSQGDAAEKSLSEQIQHKRQPWLQKNPMQRVAATNAASDITLPETPMDVMAIPDVSRKMDTMGFGSAGAGGGFGSGIGIGGKSGVTFQPIMMFGKDLKAKRLAVILDVSSSMADYLEDVVKEVDRVAKGSPVICYFGCGLMRPEKGGHIDDKVDYCKNPSFERFWRLWYGPAPFNATPEEIKKITFKPKDRIPFEEPFRVLARRPSTYFVDYNGIVYAWTALVNDLVRNADALYWFSDFMDDVDEKEMKIVLENIKRRKQRLFIQPSIHGASFEAVLHGLVEPSGGDVVEPPPKK